MTRNSRIITALFIILSVLSGAFYLAIKTHRLIQNGKFGTATVIFSHDYFYTANSSISKCVDDDLETPWISPVILPVTNRTPPPVQPDPRSPIPPAGKPYLHMELALTHFPENPPKKNQPERLILWTGGAGSEFASYSRPARVRLVIFDQEVVDVDRDYRIPDLPGYLGEKTVTLKDSPDRQIIDLNFIAPPADSPAFPRNIRQLWIRLEPLSFYRGRDDRYFAIREIDYESPIPDHPEIGEGNPP